MVCSKAVTLCIVVLLLLVHISGSAQAAGLEVVSAGVGRTPEAAVQAGKTNALRAALGRMVPVPLLVQQEGTVQERVLGQQNKFVLAVEPLGEPRVVDGGLVAILLRVQVNDTALEAALKQAGLYVTSLDGMSMVTGHNTHESSKADAGAVLGDFLRPLPAGVLKATADVGQARHRMSGTAMRIDIPVRLGIESAQYAQFVAGIHTMLEKLGVTSKVYTLPGTGSQTIAALRKAVGLAEKPSNSEGPLVLAVFEMAGENSSRWRIAQVPKPLAAAFGRDTAIGVQVELLDAAEAVVTSQEFALGEVRVKMGLPMSLRFPNTSKARALLLP